MHTVGGAGGGGGSWFTDALGGVFGQVSTWVNVGNSVQKASFSVDMDQIPGLIDKYKQAQDMMRDILQDAQQLERLGNRGAPGADEVSHNMAQAMARKASHDIGCLSWAVDDGYKRLEDQIAQLEAAKRDYEASDHTATPRIT